MSENKYSYPLIPTPQIYWVNGKLVQIWEHRDLHGTLLNQEIREIQNFQESKQLQIKLPSRKEVTLEDILNGPKENNPIVPQPVPNPDLKNLLDTMNSVLEVAEERGYMDDDAPNYVWEAAMEAFYGKEIWNWINSKK